MSSTNPTLFNRRLGAAVRARRVTAGMTQENLGNEINVTFQQVQKCERGVNRISVETLIKVAKAISTTPQQLIDAAHGEDEPVEREPGDRLRLSVMASLSRLPEKTQRLTLDFVNALAGDKAA